jgi:hypothetical protein
MKEQRRNHERRRRRILYRDRKRQVKGGPNEEKTKNKHYKESKG